MIQTDRLKSFLWYLSLKKNYGSSLALWDTSTLSMGLRVKIEKVMLILHFWSLQESILARRVFEDQRQDNWTGLILETEVICQKLEIEDCITHVLSKPQCRKLVVQAYHAMNEQNITARGLTMKNIAKRNIYTWRIYIMLGNNIYLDLDQNLLQRKLPGSVNVRNQDNAKYMET